MAFKDKGQHDLPLMANTDDVLVHHYILDLACNFDTKSFSGNITLFCKPVEDVEHCKMCLLKHGTSLSQGKNVNMIECDSNKVAASMGITKMENAVLDIETTEGYGIEEAAPNNKGKYKDNKDTVQYVARSLENTSEFKMVLDCCDISIKYVHELLVPKHLLQKLECLKHSSDWKRKNTAFEECAQNPSRKLVFDTEDWCIKLWKEGVTCPHEFPTVVKIGYSTKSHGASLKWTVDQDDNPCVFTPAAWINNRSFFPCQEPPVAMATWQSRICVFGGAMVLMSGDQEPDIQTGEDGSMSYYYQTNMSLPCSTLAIAVGHWKCSVITDGIKNAQSSTLPVCSHQHCEVTFSPDTVLPSRIFSPESLIQKTNDEFKNYVPKCFLAAHKLLGPHPFLRHDFLVTPSSFASMGLASPNLTFISQSLLARDHSLCIRLAHEVSHSWFGLLIGARDWSEEWLSEGFATFMEDLLHAEVMQWTPREAKEHAELRALIKFKMLEGELQNTKEELQTLRPNKGEVMKDPDTLAVLIKHGMNPEKSFTQVHYLKGYFLLRYLMELVGEDSFCSFLRKFVQEFHGKLVTSEEIFTLLFETFPILCDKGLTIHSMYDTWLDFPGIPKELHGFHLDNDNSLYCEVLEHAKYWKSYDKNFRKRKRKKQKCDVALTELIPDQLLLMLEIELEMDSIRQVTLQSLKDFYKLSDCNAEVRHRWCELVIKHSFATCYVDVEQFLLNEQAMGVYLFGELLYSECPNQKQLALDCFNTLRDNMDENSKAVVQEMIDTSMDSDN